MTSDQRIEERLEAWLSDGPAAAPDRLLQGVLLAVPTTPRRHGFGAGWPPELLRRPLVWVAASVATVLVIGALSLLPRPAVGPGASQARASATPTSLAIAGWDSFTSQRFGLSFAHPPGGWYVQRATEPWLIDTDPSANADRVESNGLDGSSFWAASQAVGSDVDELDWLDELASRTTKSTCYPPPARYERITIDARSAYLVDSEPCGFFQAFAFVDGRVYVLTGQGFWDARQGPPMERVLFESFLSSVRFDPAAADDGPG
jgi:hypothetical protein